MLAAQFRLSDVKKINSADGTMNKPTKNIYFLFFGVQNHLIFHEKLPGLGNFSPRIFLVSSGIRQVCDGETAWKKNIEIVGGKTAWKKNIEIVGSFNGITTTCKLMTGIFFHNSEIMAVCHVYVTQSSLKRPIHVTRDISSAREFRCGLSQFRCGMESNKDTRHKQSTNRPDYILHRIDIWCSF